MKQNSEFKAPRQPIEDLNIVDQDLDHTHQHLAHTLAQDLDQDHTNEEIAAVIEAIHIQDPDQDHLPDQIDDTKHQNLKDTLKVVAEVQVIIVGIQKRVNRARIRKAPIEDQV